MSGRAASPKRSQGAARPSKMHVWDRTSGDPVLPRDLGPVYEPAAPAGPPRLREACGVIGIFGASDDAAVQAYFALFAVQHRGQESAGIAVGDGARLHAERRMGLVSRVFSEHRLARLRGHVAVGHCRYSTAGASSASNMQPVLRNSDLGPLALGHNGNIVNALTLREEYAPGGAGARGSTSDSAVIADLIAAAPGEDLVERVRQVLPRLSGSFCLAIATPTQLIAARDGMGNRPLSLGRVNGTWVVASETCALGAVGASYDREVAPGEVVVIDRGGLRSLQLNLPQRPAICAFEYIYFSRPDSVLGDASVHSVRREMGRLLALQHPVDADLVVGVPDSAIAAATGYAEASQLPYADGFVRNRYIGRTFIEPTPRLRKLGVRMKFSALPEVTRGKRVVMVDDTIVRGTTQAALVQLLREQGGASEVHVRITAPPIRWPCFLGIDIPDPDALIAHKQQVKDICAAIGADSLGYLSSEHLVRAIGRPTEQLCLGCFTHTYPIDVQLTFDKFLLERPERLATAMVFPRESTIDRAEPRETTIGRAEPRAPVPG